MPKVGWVVAPNRLVEVFGSLGLKNDLDLVARAGVDVAPVGRAKEISAAGGAAAAAATG